MQLASFDQPAPPENVPPAPPADLTPPAPPADALPPAPPADAIPPAPPADAPPPADAMPPAPPADAPPPADAAAPPGGRPRAAGSGDANGAPGAPQQATKVGYTQKVWDAIRGEDVNGNDALDSLALPAPVS